MSKSLAFLTVSLLLAGAVPGAHAALGGDEAKCQKRVGSQGRVFLKSVQKALSKCHDKVSKGSLPAATDCTIQSDAAARIAKATSKLTAKVGSQCPDATVATLVFGGACYGVTTAAELTACLADSHQDIALTLDDTVYATSGVLAVPGQKCQSAVAKEGQTFAGKRHKLIASCKDKVSAGKLPAGTDCGAQSLLKVNEATTKGAGKIALKCADATVAGLAFGAPCAGVTTAAGLSACVLGAHADRDDALIVVEYGSGASGGAALAKHITDANADCVKGPLSRCRAGDYLLRNDRIRVVVQDLQRNLFGIGQFGGQIIDGDLVRTGSDPDRDNFEEWATAINIENTAHYTSLQILNDGSDGQAAVIRTTGVDDLLDFLNPSSVVAGFGFPFPASANDTDLPVEIVTDYVLEPGRNWVRVDTTIHNTSAGTFNIYFGDYLNASGELELFQPAYGFGDPLVTMRCPVGVANPCNSLVWSGVKAAEGVSYGYTNLVPQTAAFTYSGVSVPLIGTEVVLALIGAAPPPWTFTADGTPGDTRTFTRYFIIGDGSVSSVLDTRNDILGLPTGRIAGTVTVGGSPAAGVRVSVLGNGADAPSGLTRNVVTQAVTDATGAYALTVPAGAYTVAADVEGYPFEGGGATPTEHPVTVASYATTTQNMSLPATGALAVTLVDEANAPLAGKVSVVGFDPSPQPRNTQSIFGLINVNNGLFTDFDPDNVTFGLSKVDFFDQNGTIGPLPLEPGSYRIVVSHGPEYSIATQDVTVTAGATTSVNAQIARVVDSTGFVGSDFHVHSIESPDSRVARRDRVVTLLAEGLDFFTPSDHDIRTSYQPDINALGAASLLGTTVSGEITSFDYGHFNAWPMTIDPSKVNGGSVDFGVAAPAGQDFPQYGNYNMTPGQIMAAAASDPGVDVVQLNHIHSFFSIDGNSGLAVDSGVVPPQSAVPGSARRLDPAVSNYFDAGFTSMEIWIGESRSQVYTNFLGRNAGDWFNLMNQGIVRTGTADSDSHVRVSNQVGAPRTMVASPTDDPGSLSGIGETLATNVNAGRAFGTNAPIVRITTAAASTGETGGLELGQPLLVHTTDGAVTVTIDIQSPIWAEFDRVELYVNSTTTRTATNKESGAGPVSVKKYTITPDYTQTVTPTVVTVNGSIPGAQRLEATATFNLSGLTADSWIVAMVKGTDGVSRPLFPMLPNSLKSSTNLTLANLTDGNLGEDGMTALAFTNPLFVDVDGGSWTPPGLQIIDP